MVKERNIAVCIVLTIITCGIYGIYWFIVLTDEINMASGEPGTSGGLSFLLALVTCNIYGIYWAYKMGQQLQVAKERNGMGPGSDNSILYLILSVVGLGIVAYALMQNELNSMSKPTIY